MFAISNAMLSQVEFEQVGHWGMGPLEIVFQDVERANLERSELLMHATNWNRSYDGGYLRMGDTLDLLDSAIPGFSNRRSPNLFIALTENGISQLDIMLASLLPKELLKKHGLNGKFRSNIWLTPFNPNVQGDFVERCHKAFGEYVWSFLMPKSRHQKDFFSKDSSLHLLAGDIRLWMSRIYRVALDIREQFIETTHEEESWEPLEEISRKFHAEYPDLQINDIVIRRPLMGGELWEGEEDSQEILKMAVTGNGIMDSMENITDVLLSNQTNDDFSNRYSWVKEDFERKFYSKRARIKVTLIETADNFPAWSATEPQGYDNVLYRDIMAMLNVKERHLVVALRHGKSLSEIATDYGHACHSPISRAVKALESKVIRLLN